MNNITLLDLLKVLYKDEIVKSIWKDLINQKYIVILLLI